jgi:hypothetical protein
MTQERKRPQFDYSQVTEDFSDVFETHINPWSAAITFGRRATKEGDAHLYTMRMRMPLQQAKALAVILLRSIRSYEERSGADIDLPAEVLQALNIAPEDWRRFRGS